MYKLNLFKTDFPLVQTHPDKQAFLDLWAREDVVHALHREQGGRPLYLLHDGPPYANGSLHLGHFVNKSLKDAVLKTRRLEGYFAPFVPGFDCHGLPVELEVERRGVSKDDPAAFVQACRTYALSQVASQTAQFRTFGVAADWSAPYLTLERAYERRTAELFRSLPNRVRKLRPVHWCAACQSSLAEAEVEYKPKQSDSLTVLFALLDAQGQHDGHTFLQVWTTTPYTLPANVAVGYGESFDYVAVQEGDKTLVRVAGPADAQLPRVSLAGARARSPWTQEEVPLLPADFATAEGTGLVHLAPSFGADDFRVCEAHGLSAQVFVDESGRMVCEGLQGLSLSEASAAVLSVLEQRGLVHAHTRVEHSYPHCWRHKRPVFFRASEEWFLDLEEVAPAALQALDAVQFTPSTGKARFSAMLQGRKSWCVSRQRLWGTPLLDTHDASPESLEDWHAQGPRPTLDVWFDSGASHAAVLTERFGREADLYVEGHDQFRGWFQSSLLTSVSLGRAAPYRALLTHGFVVDAAGKKLSKSNGNYKPLEELFGTYSPDLLRLWALSQDFTTDLKLSQASLQLALERYRKLRNTVRFALQNTQDATPGHVVLTNPVHRHALWELAEVARVFRDRAQQHDFASAVVALVRYCETTSSEFFMAVKDALYCDAPDSAHRRKAQYVLQLQLRVLARLFAPLMPFTAEEVFQALRAVGVEAADSVVLATWEEALADVQAQAAELPHYSELCDLRSNVHAHVERERSGGLKSPAQLDLRLLTPQSTQLEPLAQALRDWFGCARLDVQASSAWAVEPSLTRWKLCPRCRSHQPGAWEALCPRCASAETALQAPAMQGSAPANVVKA